MRWLGLATVVLSVMATTGCPSEFGTDGRVAKAVHKDAQEQVIIIRECGELEHQQVCASGRENTKECLECGGP